MIDKIQCERRIGYDIEPYVIATLSALRDGWLPPVDVSEEEYRDVKEHKEKYPDYFVGYCGYQLSYGGIKWVSGIIPERLIISRLSKCLSSRV